MNRVAIYLRKSREDEELKEETLSRHEKMLNDYCLRNHLDVVKTYKEVVSGENIENRPQMQVLMDDVSMGKYDGVVCVELERLSRGNPIDQCEILEVFKSSDTKIYTLNKVYDLTKEEIDEEYFEFALFMSRREYKTITRRLLRGRKQARAEGYYIGAITPYGFQKVKQDKGYVLVPEPNEIEVVKDIFNKCYKGEGVTSIARDLNMNGIKPRRASQWSPQLIRLILHNRTYTGYINVASEGKWIKGRHESVIDQDMFEAVQRRIVSAPRKHQNKVVNNPFATILKCSCCGHTMRLSPNRIYVPYIKCLTLNCPNRSIKLTTLEDVVIERLKEELRGFNYILDNYDDISVSKEESRKQEIELLEKEVIKKQKMYNKACEMLEEGIYTKEVFRERAEKLTNEISNLVKSLEVLKESVTEENEIKSQIPKIEKVIDKYYTLNAEKKNELLKTIIKRIDYTYQNGCLELDIEMLL